MTDILTEFESRQTLKPPATLAVTKVAYTLIGIVIILSYYAFFIDPLYRENMKTFSWYHIALLIDCSQLVWLVFLFFNKATGLVAAILCQAHIFGVQVLNPFLNHGYQGNSAALFYVIVVLCLNVTAITFGLNKKNWIFLKITDITRYKVMILAVCSFVTGLFIKLIMG
ncbi:MULTISPECIES: hypothetical protein [unclassified Paraflavitalea]|uniref:hypothetical protein n=1 Tax=unclassified Paraflavitalea TaxID=2798305 RepID=UPI003D3426AA